MTNHTLGPWNTTERRDVVAEIWGEGNGQHEIALNIDTDANARLIAESPALLKACKWFMQQLEDCVLVRDTSKDCEPDWTMRMLRFTVSLAEANEAIGRAEGGTE